MTPMPERTTVRFTRDDLALLDAIQAQTGIVSRSEVLRRAIRALAKQEKVPAPQPKTSRKRWS